MNSKQILGVLLAITFFVTGCKPENFTGNAASGVPMPQQTLRLSEPVKVILSDSTINLERLGHITIAGNTLIATTNVSNTSHPISIDMEDGQVQGLQSPLRLTSTETFTVRYISRRTSYEKDNHSVGELFMYDLQQGKEFKIADNLPDSPEISGNIAVWQGLGKEGWGIYAYDIDVSQSITVAIGSGVRAFPHVSGNWVIYLDIEQEATLHAYNISTKEDLKIGTVADPKHDSQKRGKYHLIGGEKVIWADATDYKLHVYNLNTQKAEVLSETLTTCQPLYWLESMVGHTLLYAGCNGWALYDLDSKASVTIPVFPLEIQARMTQTPNEDATYSMGWIVMSDTRLAWTVIDGLGHSWLYTSRIER